jgi:hypothetical protein
MSGDAEAALGAAQHAVEISLRARSAHTATDLRRAARLLKRVGADTVADEVREMAEAGGTGGI